MKLFSDLSEEALNEFFYVQPQSFSNNTEKDLLSYALGATLYMPATRKTIYYDIVIKKYPSLTSIVLCLEDSIGDHEVDQAEQNLLNELNKLDHDIKNETFSADDLPLLFIRIRDKDQFQRLIMKMKHLLPLLTGIVIPKFDSKTSQDLFKQIDDLNHAGNHLYVMPILETGRVLHKETRLGELMAIKSLLDQYRENILNIRIGATDFCGLYGIRRNSDTTVYDIAVIRDCIADIVNVFSRAESPYVISGPVWEHFSVTERLLKPQLRQTPFQRRYGKAGISMRSQLLDKNMDGFIHEIMLDITNGLTGKTIIHPTHIRPVQALNVVSYEEYLDAKLIIENATGEIGVIKSLFSNKMNEIKPHYYWAQKTLFKSQIYGVSHENCTYIDLLENDLYTSHY
jgi:citrate lyase beta subunit